MDIKTESALAAATLETLKRLVGTEGDWHLGPEYIVWNDAAALLVLRALISRVAGGAGEL